MAVSHTHTDTGSSTLRLRRWARITVLAVIALSGVAAVLGILRWLPQAERVDELHGLIPFAVEGIEVVHGELITVRPACAGEAGETATSCGASQVQLLDGPNAGAETEVSLTPNVTATGLAPGDHVLLLDQTQLLGSDEPSVAFYRADRGPTMLWLVLLFVVAVVAVARLRGLMALVSLGFAGALVIWYLIPALLSGQPAVPVTIATSTLILIVMLYVTHGVSMRTSVALLGALVGVGITTVLAWVFIIGSRVAGLGDESVGLLAFNVTWIDVQQLIVASVILAGLGTLNDVTITQVSALWELRAASPEMSRLELFGRAMRIGRDHIASTVYTLIFAYLGTALAVLVAAQLFGGTLLDFVTAENVAEEVVRALAGGVALILAMPITTAIGALVVTDATVRLAPSSAPVAPRAEAASAPRITVTPPSEFTRLPRDPLDES